MISINKQGNAIVIEFTDNDKYLFNGTIEVAPNELMIVIDESNMATFKRSTNGDTLFSQLINKIQIGGTNVTKDTILDEFAKIGFTTVNWSEITGKPTTFSDWDATEGEQVIANKPDLNEYATKAEVNNMIGDIGTILDQINGEVIYGVFIYDTNGNLTKPEEWDTANNNSAVGVAVIDENCSFVIGKEESEYKAWSNTLNGTLVSGIVATTDSSTAKTDYAGEANSSIVRGLTSGEDNAFNWAYSNTITVNGTTINGYLGALGEWQTAYDNRSSIDSALRKIGGDTMLVGYEWVSTQYSSDNAWALDLVMGDTTNRSKEYTFYVRAFYHLNYSQINKEVI